MLIIRLLISLLLSPNNYARVSGPDMVDDARDHSLIEENGIESVLPLWQMMVKESNGTGSNVRRIRGRNVVQATRRMNQVYLILCIPILILFLSWRPSLVFLPPEALFKSTADGPIANANANATADGLLLMLMLTQDITKVWAIHLLYICLHI